MISLPDELLARLDAEAAERGSTRSAMIRDLSEAALGERERLLADRMRQLDGDVTRHGGDVAGALTESKMAVGLRLRLGFDHLREQPWGSGSCGVRRPRVGVLG
jgi:predicted DNA-binding protein